MIDARPRARLLVVALGLLAGCADDDSARREPAPKPVTVVGGDQSVLEGCSMFAARLCESARECCESAGAPYSAETCRDAFIRQACRPAADVVAAGIATYHPEAEEACLAAYQRAHATCVADWHEIIGARREIWDACKMIRGTVEQGRGCSTSSACAQPDGPATARCIQTACRVIEVLGEGAECAYPNGDVSVCDDALYCTATERDVPGVCARAVTEGGACDPAVPLNPECGLGSYCGLDDGRCHRATNFGGPSCTQGTECVSFTCDSIIGSCAEAPSLAADLCASGAP